MNGKVIEVAISRLNENELSANKEDSMVFERLKKELHKWGIVELPVVVKDGEGYRIIAGHHRIRAWKALGHDTVKAVVIERKMDKEEEFNLVNNLNLIKGDTSKGEIIKKVRQHKLNPEKIDLFRYPTSQLFPRLSTEDIKTKEDEQKRLAKINEMTLAVAKEIAKAMVDRMSDLCFMVRDSLCGYQNF